MSKKTAFTISFIASLSFCFSQAGDTTNNVKQQSRYEVGVDMQSLFLKSPSTTIILKKQSKKKHKENNAHFMEPNLIKNYRFQLGISGNIPLDDKVTVYSTNTNTLYSVQKNKSLNVQAMFGQERVKLYGKFNFYYGCDIGLYYTYSYLGYDSYMAGNTNIIGQQINETNKIGLAIVPFVGAKYRFTEHFSASMESSFYITYFVSKYTNGIMNGLPIITQISSGLQFYPQYLRFLTLNYHF